MTLTLEQAWEKMESQDWPVGQRSLLAAVGNYYSPMDWAVLHEDTDVAECLFQAGVSIQKAGSHTLVGRAISTRKPIMLEWLLQKGVERGVFSATSLLNPGCPPNEALLFAVQLYRKHLREVGVDKAEHASFHQLITVLLKYGETWTSSKVHHGYQDIHGTPLDFIGTFSHYEPLFQMVLDHPTTDFTARAQLQGSFVHQAIKSHLATPISLENIEQLMAKDGRWLDSDKHYMTVLDFALGRQHWPFVYKYFDVFKEHYPTRTWIQSLFEEPFSSSPLYESHSSVEANEAFVCMVSFLVSKGEDLAWRGQRGDRLMHKAVVAYPCVAQSLVEMGAPWQSLNENNRSPLDVALNFGRSFAVKTLVQAYEREGDAQDPFQLFTELLTYPVNFSRAHSDLDLVDKGKLDTLEWLLTYYPKLSSNPHYHELNRLHSIAYGHREAFIYQVHALLLKHHFNHQLSTAALEEDIKARRL